MRAIQVVVTDENQGYVCAEWVDKLDNGHILAEDASMGDIYRCYAKSYGRCTSKVYRDTENGVQCIGWFYVKRERYEDTNEPYLQGAWVTVGEYVAGVAEHVA